MKVIRVEGDVAYVELTQGHETIIDAADVPLVRSYSWHVTPNVMGGFYARAPHGLYMHRLILGVPRGKQADHINHDTLDNRRTNLRIVTNQENNQNRNGAYKTSKTGIRNVCVHKTNNGSLMYVARVAVNRKPICRYFPYTPEGLEDAKIAAEELRREHFPMSH